MNDQRISKFIIETYNTGVKEGEFNILEKCCDKCYEKLKQDKVKDK